MAVAADGMPYVPMLFVGTASLSAVGQVDGYRTHIEHVRT